MGDGEADSFVRRALLAVGPRYRPVTILGIEDKLPKFWVDAKGKVHVISRMKSGRLKTLEKFLVRWMRDILSEMGTGPHSRSSDSEFEALCLRLLAVRKEVSDRGIDQPKVTFKWQDE